MNTTSKSVKLLRLITLMFWAFGMNTLAHAATVRLKCPKTLDVQETAGAVPGWQIEVSSSAHTFARMRLYSGPPENKLLLDPDNGDDDPTDYRWTLGDAGNNLWVRCDYHGTAARLVQSLPKGLSSCQLLTVDKDITLYCQSYVPDPDE